MWTKPHLMARWMSPYPGPVTCEAEADAKVGGRFSLRMGGGDSVCEISGTYVEVEPHSRLAFTWCGETTLNVDTLVTVQLSPVPEGTELLLTHERLAAPARNGYSGGWQVMLDHMADADVEGT
jgi:uncharacterized protein YndB with AHSA1/START domain